MIETWRDSWFQEGMRIFYLVPRQTVDAVLPLKIAPAPGYHRAGLRGTGRSAFTRDATHHRGGVGDQGDTNSTRAVWAVSAPILRPGF